jgi:trans-2,3-dihydro-3-hydroxyanthranilate isomerase
MRYLHLDVFTDTPLRGNQLAVFPDARGMDSALMQRIAREFNFSETTFILPAETEGTDVRMRIFTPSSEVPIAGHPTVGSTFAAAHAGIVRPGTSTFTFGLNIGPTRVALDWQDGQLSFVWMTQPLPQFGCVERRIDGIAHALGVDPDDIRRTNLPVQEVSCGLPFLYVPVASREAVDVAVPDRRSLDQAYKELDMPGLPVFLFTPETGTEARPTGDGGTGVPAGHVTAYSRMFAPDFGIEEDPATGIASGPLGSYLVKHGVVPPERAGSMVSLQGVKMGRHSRITIAIDLTDGDITGVRIGGKAVLVAEGDFLVRHS